jgi:hypothetical protein
MVVRPGSDLDLLELDRPAPLARVVDFLAGLVLELAIVHDLADGRVRARGNFDDIEPFFARNPESFGDRYDAELFSIRRNEPDLLGPDLSIDSDFLNFLAYGPYLL